MRRLLIHEARVHAVPGRTLRDLGDAIMLTDPVEPEPFWNRIEGVRWPVAADAFDRRLTEVLIQFATLGRQAHIWASPLHDTPGDLVARLISNGFRDMGPGNVMVLADRVASGQVPDPPERGVEIERLAGLRRAAARTAAAEIVDVLEDAFDVGQGRRPGLDLETEDALTRPWFTYYLARMDGRPVAVARRATFDGASYLSSIGTAGWARGRGLGTTITRVAAADAVRAGSEWTYLGVFADNRAAIRVYERAGFERVGEPAPDLLLA